ncbi:MAG: CvpA family protein [Candidatus Omnitrophica bacterium]|nr:CvpA family protein [Candidatus Omnitrophota bacterium]
MMILAAATPAEVRVDWLLIWTKMGWLDIVFLLVFAIGIFLGLKRGLAKVSERLIEVVVAQIVTIEYSRAWSEWIQIRVHVPFELLHVVVFAALAIVSIIAVRFIFRVLELFAAIEFKSPLNGVGGALLGGFQHLLFLSLISSFLLLFPLPFIQTTFKDGSISGPYLASTSQKVHDTFVKWFPGTWRAL